MHTPRSRIVKAGLLLVLIGGLATGFFLSLHAMRGTRLGTLVGLKAEKKDKDVYYCPMHPYYTSEKPGECPICHMTLVKLEKPERDISSQGEKAAPGGAGAAAGGTARERKVLYWVDAMNPSFRSDKPGKAPDGMDLVPVYAEEGQAEGEAPPGGVRISPEKQQLIGVQYGTVSEGPVTRTIRTVGRIGYDETKITRVHTKVDGWIEKVFVDFTGKLVKKGQPLISIYSPELVSTQQEFLLSSRARDSLKESPIGEVASGALSLYESARERLKLWDIPEAEIEAIEKRGVPSKALTLYAPRDGFVLARNAFENQRVTPETELYTIADLSTVWVLADIYEYEAPMITLGQTAIVTLAYFPGETFASRVSYIYPQIDNTSRTLRVRMELDNPEFRLKPDMYAEVELTIDYGRHVSVPDQAVLDAGIEQIVFVAVGDGYFEPRRVQVGAKVDDRFIVLSGLRPGEKIVTSGTFLIDSESQLKAALGGMAGMPGQEHGGKDGEAPAAGGMKAPGPGDAATLPAPGRTGGQGMPGMDKEGGQLPAGGGEGRFRQGHEHSPADHHFGH